MDSGLVSIKGSDYFISANGDVYSNYSGNMTKLKGYVQKNGYKVVKLRKLNESKVIFRVHRLVRFL